MTKKDAYKRMLSSYGAITLAYLITYYEDLQEYEECSIILTVLEDLIDKNGDKTIPKRFNKSAVEWYNKLLETSYGKNSSVLVYNIKEYANQVRSFIDKECS